MKALITNRGLLSRIPNMLLNKSTGSIPSIQEVHIPTLAPNDLLIKVHTVSLNPIDVKFIDFLAPPNSALGCDFAGVVSSIGSEVTGTWKTGDRVAGFVQGGLTSEYGSFAEYVKAESDLVWKIPESISDEDASTWGISGVTAMLALNRHLKVPWLDRDGNSQQQAQNNTTGPNNESSPILIYAGSTSVGLFAIQLAKAANLTVITTCSPHSFDLVKSYGADAVYDYRSSTAVQDIAASYPNISRALDCISEGTSTDFCARVMSEKGGKVVTLLPTKTNVSGVEVKPIMSFQLLGKAFAWLPPVGPKYEASAMDRAALVKFYAGLNGLSRMIKAPPVTVLEGGFPAVLDGLDRLRAGKVSGSKLVVRF
jgi:NADPH:quinone reductase-like Zn-dependent oxidoreductase